MVKRRWAINSAFMAFYAFGAVLVCWVLWAYKAAFGEKMLPIVGRPGNVIGIGYEIEQALLPASGATAAFPMSTMGQWCLIVSLFHFS
jgi:Amt family ammonium transporter